MSTSLVSCGDSHVLDIVVYQASEAHISFLLVFWSEINYHTLDYFQVEVYWQPVDNLPFGIVSKHLPLTQFWPETELTLRKKPVRRNANLQLM